MKESLIVKLNKDFIWGTATSSYQIEGAINDDGKGLNIWDTFCMKEGNILDGTDGKIACDHYNRYEEDVQLIKNLGVSEYRFSLSWARLFPFGTGNKNQEGFDFYNKLINSLLENGVTPWITFYHWDLPATLQDEGGWTNPDCHKWFAEYAHKSTEVFSDRVKNYFLLNEPSVACFEGHLTGFNAPGLKSKTNYLKAVHQQNLAIKKGYEAVKSFGADLNVGSTFTYFPVRPAQNGDEFIKARNMMDCLWNRASLDPILLGKYPDLIIDDLSKIHPQIEPTKTPLDFVGLQHYCPSYAYPNTTNDYNCGFGPSTDNQEETDMGWPIDPKAFTECLIDFKQKYGDINIYISENGCAMPDVLENDGTVQDIRRIKYFENYLEAMKNAMDKGVIIKGYFIWSMFDNFEWAFGLSKRFGIVYLDYKNDLKRIPKASYVWWQKYLKALKEK